MIPGIYTPINNTNTKKILDEIKTAEKQGRLHILYMDYQKKTSNSLSSNILVPYKTKNIIQDLIIVNHPDDAERLATTHIKKMPNLKPLLYDSIISTTNNEKWKCQRQNLTPAFNVYEKLEKIIPISEERAEICSELLWETSNNGNTEININEFFLNETMAQLQMALFGFDNQFQEDTNIKIRGALDTFDRIYGKEYLEKFLCNIKQSDGPLGTEMNDYINQYGTLSQNIGNTIIFTFAGHDTTGHTLTWLIYEICKNQLFQIRLQKEVDRFWLEQEDKNIVYKDFKRLPFMTRCIQETLRLWPALANGTFRELETDDYIHGIDNKKIKIKKGTYIQIPNFSRHRNPYLWGYDSFEYNPDRHFEDDELWNDKVIGTYNPNSKRYSPFTYTPRDCIGKNFAQIEMRVILLYILKDYTFKLTSIQKNMDRNKIMYNSFTMGPRSPYIKSMEDRTNGLYVYIEKRQLYSKL